LEEGFLMDKDRLNKFLMDCQEDIKEDDMPYSYHAAQRRIDDAIKWFREMVGNDEVALHKLIAIDDDIGEMLGDSSHEHYTRGFKDAVQMLTMCFLQ
jgi:hypothetical protein